MEAMGMESKDHKVSENAVGLLNKDDEAMEEKDEDDNIWGLNDSVASLKLENKLIAMHDKQAMT